jgi:hypothetical protein
MKNKQIYDRPQPYFFIVRPALGKEQGKPELSFLMRYIRPEGQLTGSEEPPNIGT